MSNLFDLLLSWLAAGGVFLGWTACILLCLGGLLLAVFSISGTWLVLAAAALAAVLTGPAQFPGWPVIIGMAAVCAAVDIIEWFAASWGVRRRGGSRAAGWLALLGTIAGAILGGMVVPILGSLVGMMIGSFALVYWSENRRLRHTAHAAHIATGAVLAAMSVLILKVLATSALTLWLTAGLLL
jgi:uncharacterized protein YqgC (DUF456 family)